MGKNPATTLPISTFDSMEQYWSALAANPQAFWRANCGYRKKDPSKTSVREYTLAKNLVPLNVLVSNVWSYPVPSGGTVPVAFRKQGEEVLKCLIDICRPKVIFLYSQTAVDFGNSYLRPTRPLELWNDDAWSTAGHLDSGESVRLFSYPHLSGLGAPAGFPVADIDEHLISLARGIHDEYGIEPKDRHYLLRHLHPCERADL